MSESESSDIESEAISDLSALSESENEAEESEAEASEEESGSEISEAEASEAEESGSEISEAEASEAEESEAESGISEAEASEAEESGSEISEAEASEAEASESDIEAEESEPDEDVEGGDDSEAEKEDEEENEAAVSSIKNVKIVSRGKKGLQIVPTQKTKGITSTKVSKLIKETNKGILYGVPNVNRVRKGRVITEKMIDKASIESIILGKNSRNRMSVSDYEELTLSQRNDESNFEFEVRSKLYAVVEKLYPKAKDEKLILLSYAATNYVIYGIQYTQKLQDNLNDIINNIPKSETF
jgi:hypothetical protein